MQVVLCDLTDIYGCSMHQSTEVCMCGKLLLCFLPQKQTEQYTELARSPLHAFVCGRVG
eukprot:m.734157 g.734157  ORF g.734157 m.734157 type:complete len:59 (-) comp23079_c0_seq1:150-326(-)